MGFYDDVRILQHHEELKKVQAGRAGECIPIHVRIEPTEVCNFRCRFCWWHNEDKRRTLSNFKFTGKEVFAHGRLLSLIEELAQLGTKALSFTGAGDPLMYPHMTASLNRAHELGLVFGVTSNMAVPMSDELVAALVKASWLRWSINAGTLETFLAVADPKGRDSQKKFRLVQENVRRINQARWQQTGCSEFNASYVVSENNQEDILSAARLVKNLGVDSIAFRPDTPIERQAAPNVYPEKVAHNIERAQQKYQSDVYQVYMNIIRQEDVQKYEDPGLICFYSNHTTYIDARGDVYPCCYTRYHARYVIGNVMEQDFTSFWHSSRRSQFYKQLVQDACPACGYGRFNKALRPLYQGVTKAKDMWVKRAPKDYFI